MPNIIHMCVDPMRCFSEAAYPGKLRGNKFTEAAVTEIIKMTHIFNQHGIPTFWNYLDKWDNKKPIDECGGGLHPRLAEAFPNYRDTALPKYDESAFSDVGSSRVIVAQEPKLIIFSGFLTSLCLRKTVTDMDMFYPRYPLSKTHRYIPRETTADSDGQIVLKGGYRGSEQTDDELRSDNQKFVPYGLETMVRSGAVVGSVANIPQLIQHYSR